MRRRVQDRRFPNIDSSSLGAGRTQASLSVDERLLPAGFSHDAAAAAPWLTRRSISGPVARTSLAGEKASPTDEDQRCCSCWWCRNVLLRRFRVNRCHSVLSERGYFAYLQKSDVVVLMLFLELEHCLHKEAAL